MGNTNKNQKSRLQLLKKMFLSVRVLNEFFLKTGVKFENKKFIKISSNYKFYLNLFALLEADV